MLGDAHFHKDFQLLLLHEEVLLNTSFAVGVIRLYSNEKQ